MDTPQTITCLEWCFGYGGIHLGLKRVIPGLRCIAASEIEAYAIANLVAKIEAGFLEPFPIWSNLKTFPCELFRDLVDIFIAGYPCQPFSSSGKRNGADDPRHLWPFVRRAAEIIRPRFVFFENVEGHVSLGLREVLTELALLGYRVENSRGEPTWGIFSAAEVGAPQNRKRVFILGKREGVDLVDALCEQVGRFYTRGFFDITAGTGAGELAGNELGANGSSDKQQLEKRSKELSRSLGLEDSEGRRAGAIPTRSRNEGNGTAKSDWAGEGVGLANPSGTENSTRQRNDGTRRQKQRLAAGGIGVGLADAKEPGWQGCGLRGHVAEYGPIVWPDFIARPGQEQHEWEPPRVIAVKRGLGGGVNGRAANVDRLRLLGNGVYPATATKAFCELMMRFKT